MEQPKILVLPTLRRRSWQGRVPVDVPDYDTVPLREALQTVYRTDAMFTAYGAPPIEAPSPWGRKGTSPRLGKGALAYFLMDHHAASAPSLEVLFVDVDHKDHTAPDDDWHIDIVSRVPDDVPFGWYRTTNGLRLIIVPKKPIPLALAPAYLDRFIDLVQKDWGIPADDISREWNRVYRAPRATRDGVLQDLPRDYSKLTHRWDWEPEGPLQPANIRGMGRTTPRAEPSAFSNRALTRQDLQALKGAPLYDDLYHNRLADITEVSTRHKTLLEAAAIIVDRCNTRDPQIPFDLLSPTVQRMQGKTPDELWRICEWVTAAHAAMLDAEREEAEGAIDEAAVEMNVEPAEVKRRLILDFGSEYAVWNEDIKGYVLAASSQRQVHAALRKHCPRLSAGLMDLSSAEIWKEAVYNGNSISFTYVEEEAGFDTTTEDLRVQICARDPDLRPVYHDYIDEWLRAIGGNDADHLLDWLAAFPRLQRPVCALYVNGAPSIGKNMLVSGLARLYSRDLTVVPYAQLVGEFQSSLKDSPLVHADENVPQDAFTPNDSSVFRRIVGNDVRQVRDLYRAPVTLRGCPRVVITANNEDALQIRESLDLSDLEALQLRIGYIHADDGARKVLARQAAERSFDSAREWTDAWVTGGWIAEHVLWLAENREFKPGQRFLVEGWPSALSRALATAAGGAGAIAEALCIAIVEGRGGHAVRWFGGKVYVNSTELANEWRFIVGNDLERCPSSNARLKALKSLAQEETARLRTQGGGQKRYWAIDAEVLAEVAEKRGVAEASEIIEICSCEDEHTSTPGDIQQLLRQKRSPEA